MNIIFGIIIDTFAGTIFFLKNLELRDNKNTKDDDMENKCYICNLDRHKVRYTCILSLKIIV